MKGLVWEGILQNDLYKNILQKRKIEFIPLSLFRIV